MEVVGSLADGLVHSGEGDGAVDQGQMVRVGVAFAVAIGLAEAASQTVEHVVGTEGVTGMSAELGGHGDFIVHAVAVQIASLSKGSRNFSQLFGSGGHVHAHLLQPVSIDDQRTGGQHQALHLLNVGEAVHVTIGVSGLKCILGIVFQHTGNRGAVLLNQIFRGKENTLIRITDNIVSGLAFHESPEDVRQVIASSQHQGDLLGQSGNVGVEHRPLKMDSGVLFPTLNHGQLTDIHSTGSVTLNSHSDGTTVGLFKGLLVGNDGQVTAQVQKFGCIAGLAASFAGRSVARGLTAGGRLTAAAAARKRHGQQQERCQKQRKGSLFHDCTSKKCCTLLFSCLSLFKKDYRSTLGCGQAPPFLRLGAQSANHFLFKRT